MLHRTRVDVLLLKVGVYTFLLVSLMFTITGCGISQEVAQTCGGTFKGICHGIFGPEDRDDGQDDRLDDLEDRVSQLEDIYETLDLFVQGLQTQINNLTYIASQLQIDLDTNIADLQSQIDAIQSQANDQAVDIVELQTEYRVIEVMDPCGDGAGFDEVLLRASNGDLIAYFEQGSKRFLSILAPGNYATTDGTSCNFTIDSQGRLCDNLGCR